MQNVSSIQFNVDTQGVIEKNCFNNNKTVQNSIFDKAGETKILLNEYQEARDRQGIIGKAWNRIKSFFNIGHSTKDVEKAIKQFENGEISFEEAKNSIESFEKKQDGMVDIITNTASGIIVGASAIATGGLSLGVVTTGAAIGAGAKAGIKTLDRATNKVENDELNIKQILKDGITGGVDGAVTVATMGFVKPVGLKEVANQSLKETVIKGAIQGVKAGAISGSVTGAANYTTEAVFEEDVEFNAGELVKTAAQNAISGGVMGGIMGGISSGSQYKKVENNIVGNARGAKKPQTVTNNETEEELLKTAKELNTRYKNGINDVRDELQEYFGDLDTLDGQLTARAKGVDSTYEKLVDKFNDGKLTSTDIDSCAKKIGDGYGARMMLKNLDEDQARRIVEGTFKEGESYEGFIKALNEGNELKGNYLSAMNKLKEAQTNEVAERMAKLIEDGKLVLADDEFNNYGDVFSSYFTDEQLNKIGKAYANKTGKSLKIVSKQGTFNESTTRTTLDDFGEPKVETVKCIEQTEKGIEKAAKESGYTSTQCNLNAKRTTSETLNDIELQIRGGEVNDFADVEHIAYDIRKGKIKEFDERYKDIYNSIKNMSDESYDTYNQYLKDTYKYLRMKELGITIKEPSVPTGLKLKETAGGTLISSSITDKLSKEGLKILSRALHS